MGLKFEAFCKRLSEGKLSFYFFCLTHDEKHLIEFHLVHSDAIVTFGFLVLTFAIVFLSYGAVL